MIDIQQLPKFQQAQCSLSEQLQDIISIANRFGLYDAADAITQWSQTKDVRYGCHCDPEPHMVPGGCVIDEERYHDCIYAAKGLRKEQCEFWRIIV